MSINISDNHAAATAARINDLNLRLDRIVLDAFSADDFHKVDMRAIAEAGGMSFTTIYKYYGGKEGLLFSFIDSWLQELRDKVMSEISGQHEVAEKIRAALRCYFEFYEANPKVGKVVFMTVPMQTWMKTDMFDRRGPIGLLEEVLRTAQAEGVTSNAIPVLLATDSLVGAFSRAFIMWQHRGCCYSFTGQLPALFDLFWQGLQPRRAAS